MPPRGQGRARGGYRRARPDREQQIRYFVGTEGRGDKALARWIEQLCINEGARVWFDVRDTGPGAGSTAAVVRKSLTTRRNSQRGPYKHTLIFLDEDRRAADGPAAEVLADDAGIHLFWQRPNLEGLFIRLYLGQETRQPVSDQTFHDLQRLWPGYTKNRIAARDLVDKFTIEDLRRAAQFDPHLMTLLTILGLNN